MPTDPKVIAKLADLRLKAKKISNGTYDMAKQLTGLLGDSERDPHKTQESLLKALIALCKTQKMTADMLYDITSMAHDGYKEGVDNPFSSLFGKGLF